MSDQPFLDWNHLDEAASIMVSRGWDFVLPLTFEQDCIYGAGIFPWSWRTFAAIVAGSNTSDEREHAGMWLRRHLTEFQFGLRDLPHWCYRPYRLELDEPDDLTIIRKLYRDWLTLPDQAAGEPPSLRWVVQHLDSHPELAKINSRVVEKTGTFISYTQDEIERWRYEYAGREVVWSDVAGLVGSIREARHADYVCQRCGGNMVALAITRPDGNLRTQCIRCNHTRTFYAIKPKGD